MDEIVVELLGERLAQVSEPESDPESLSSGSALYSLHSAGVGEVATQP